MPLLENVRVVSLAVNLPGPCAVGILRDLGASVLKVEPPSGDMLEFSQPQWYAKLHENVHVIRLNLKEPAGRASLDVYLEQADLLLTSNRPAALARLGLDWPALHRRFPRLCQVAIVGYPGEDENLAGHDLTYQARWGLLSPPEMPKTLIADLGGAQRAALEAVAVLFARDRGQPAAYRSVALSEAAEFFALPFSFGLTTPGGGLGGGLPGYRLYQARDGWVAVAALEPHFLEGLRRALEVEDATHEAFAEAFRRRPAAEWESWANERGLPVAAVRASKDPTSPREPVR